MRSLAGAFVRAIELAGSRQVRFKGNAIQINVPVLDGCKLQNRFFDLLDEARIIAYAAKLYLPDQVDAKNTLVGGDALNIQCGLIECIIQARLPIILALHREKGI